MTESRLPQPHAGAFRLSNALLLLGQEPSSMEERLELKKKEAAVREKDRKAKKIHFNLAHISKVSRRA